MPFKTSKLTKALNTLDSPTSTATYFFEQFTTPKIHPDLIPTIETYQQKKLEGLSETDSFDNELLDDREEVTSIASISEDRKIPVHNMLQRRLLRDEMQHLEKKMSALKNAPYATRDPGTLEIEIEVQSEMLAKNERKFNQLKKPENMNDEFNYNVWFYSASEKAILEGQQYTKELLQEKESCSKERNERKEEIDNLKKSILEIKEEITELKNDDRMLEVLQTLEKNRAQREELSKIKAELALGRDKKHDEKQKNASNEETPTRGAKH